MKGRFRGIKVIQRGVSPRVVARRGRRHAAAARASTGADAAPRLGLSTPGPTSPRSPAARRRRPAPAAHRPTLPARASHASVAGTVLPARVGAEVQIQHRESGHWTTVASTLVRHGGNYRAAVATAGTYRAIFAGDAGPSIRVR